jgi:hypothetical protein
MWLHTWGQLPGEYAHLGSVADILMNSAVDVCNVQELVLFNSIRKFLPGGRKALAVSWENYTD